MIGCGKRSWGEYKINRWHQYNPAAGQTRPCPLSRIIMRPTLLCFFVASLLSVVAGVAVPGSSSWSFASVAQKERCTPTGKFCPGYGEANCCSGKCNVLRGPGFVRIGICSQ
ncbi:hypothetical protein M404DRAFT_779721 [Pisolithus tinctorius Marx 270]|uniref:Uncharacterized protein n=1 Tax=Pisolithus tinctorius Marx 270 TaxID=870435 RepID=A0A0C3NF39_PISTI|nr:hypothetical protein M404DRAFT_779721 [Pisolithus tinctorius Marx 270]